MQSLILTFFIGFLAPVKTEDIKYLLINESTGSIVDIENNELKIDFENSSIACTEIEAWIPNSPFQLNGDLKDFLVRTSPHFFIDSAMIDCKIKVPKILERSQRVEQLLSQGYKIAITFHYNRKLSLLAELEKFIEDDTKNSGEVKALKSDFNIIATVIKNQFEPFSSERVETYWESLELAKEKRNARDSISLAMIHNELENMARNYKESLSGNKAIKANRIKVKVDLLKADGSKPALKRVVYCSFFDYHLKRTVNFKTFSALNPPYEGYLEKNLSYMVWASNPDSFEPISDSRNFNSEELEANAKETKFELLITK